MTGESVLSRESDACLAKFLLRASRADLPRYRVARGSPLRCSQM
jgi:hypothetical protein